jgi:hypothetical protein
MKTRIEREGKRRREREGGEKEGRTTTDKLRKRGETAGAEPYNPTTHKKADPKTQTQRTGGMPLDRREK